jgi:hypothetical protein
MATKSKSEVAELDITRKAKKKKRISTALTVSNSKRISKLDKGLRSIIGDDAERIQQMLENNSDSVASLIHKRLLQALVDTLATAEHNVRESGGAKGVYALNSLVTSVRELLIDVQSTQDRGVLGQTIVDQVIRPNVLDIAMLMVRDSEILKGKLRGMLDVTVSAQVQKLHDEFVKRIADEIQARYFVIQSAIIKQLQG